MILGPKLIEYHENYMRLALAAAQRAYDLGETPVGAVAVYRDMVLATSHNRREILPDPTAHAEILALQKAAQDLNNWRLTDVTLYVTLEPCIMCAGAILQARLGRLVFGAYDPKAGAVGSVTDIIRTPLFPNNTEVLGGILADRSSELLSNFFADKRRDGREVEGARLEGE